MDYLGGVVAALGYGDGLLKGGAALWEEGAESWAKVATYYTHLNDYDEPTDPIPEYTSFRAQFVPVTKRLQESLPGDWEGVEVMLRVRPGTLSQGEKVCPMPPDGTFYKVHEIHEPRIGGQTLCQNAKLTRVHGSP